MSTNDTTPVESQDVDLDTFSADFFGQNEAAPETTNSDEVISDDVEDSDAIEENDGTLSEPEDDNSGEDDDNLDEDETPEANQPRKKNRFQERIDELTEARRRAERDAEDLRKRLEALEAAKVGEDQNKPHMPDLKNVTADNDRPDPFALNEDGSLKYPLAEYDPQFNVDLTNWTIEQSFKSREDVKAQEAEQLKKDQTQAELQAHWNTEVEAAQERYPDFKERGEHLVSVFEGIDQQYGEYLTMTLMDMENGTDVLYYLANNLDEAKQIVDSGPMKATIALGRIQSKFGQDNINQPSPKKVTNAPKPPPQNRGSAASRPGVAPDTDDLDAFSKEFFKKK